MPTPEPARIAIVGDLHDFWSDRDVDWFNASDYQLLLFAGDLGRGEETSRRISLSIARLELPVLIMPGNADAPHAARLAAEFSLRRGLDRLFGDEPGVEGVRLCGYSTHRLAVSGCDVTLVCGRPYSMGGPELAFEPQLHGSFGVGSLEDSAKRLVELVDRAETERLVFLSHNGPSGLGADPSDPWGCDFLPERADWGDPDLAVALEHARAQGRQVLAVVAGHMHLRLKGSEVERAWLRREAGTLFVNPARVPRIVQRGPRSVHHHVALTLTPERAEAREVFVEL